jgi:dihydropteroate synthase
MHLKESFWRLRTRTLPLGIRTLVMGIVNVTPDSFSDGGSFFTHEAAVSHALKLLDEGADLLDLGGESTRPGATPISSDEEQSRVLPVLKAILKARSDAIVSVDTYHAATAKAALDAGAEIVNDVSGLLWDPAMASMLAASQAGCVLMHTRGRPADWRTLPSLAPEEVVPLVRDGLAATVTLAEQAGIGRESIVLDPGFGFGKLGAENFTLLAGLGELQRLGFPLLVGISRKRFLTAGVASANSEAREHATTAANTIAILRGAHILRVHDVAAAVAAVNVAES